MANSESKKSGNPLLRGMNLAERGVKDRIKSADNISIAKTERSAPKTAPPPEKKKPVKKKELVVRSTFSFPKGDLEQLDKLITRLAKRGTILNKSEILRLGIIALTDTKDADLQPSIEKLNRIKSGRPKMDS